jgi:ribosomal protein L13E
MKARKDRRIEQLAELMADGYEIKDAAPTIGITVDRTRRLWRGIKRDLGWQAE